MSKRGCFPIFRRADDVTRTMSKGGGGACECPRVGAFFKLMTSRGQCPKGGGVRLVFHPSKFRPPPTWLAGYGPVGLHVYKSLSEVSLEVCSRT